MSTKSNPRYSNGNLRRKYQTSFKAKGCECGICKGALGPIHYDEPSDHKHPLSFVIDEIKPVSRWQECIELWNGGSIEFSSRSRQGVRGFDGMSLIVFDEAQELTDDQIEAILATLAASSTGTRQIIYTSPRRHTRRLAETSLNSAAPSRHCLQIKI